MVTTAAKAREADYSQYWNGVWIAEGTLFSVAVTVVGGRVELRQLESLGFEWSADNGKVAGAVLEIEVDYAGVSGIIEARLQDAATAVVSARSCLPDYRVVCALARNRQATFRKVEN
ncbi:MAG: hypothetical protein OXF82_08895 [Gammaproteobacteria bacterium]|nr:hypothetical protein [Gammaproteobacteria bacterium]